MAANILTSLLLLAVAFGTWLPRAFADSTNATCEVQKGGEKNKKASGPCTFSEGKDEVKISLHNGNSFTLTPAKKENRFKDQKGNKIGLKVSGTTREYKWDGGRTITVSPGAKSDAATEKKPAATP